ncbi:MAG: hypothetical protein IKI64_11090 [Clostridia bacterium]|nr:hypothetical protein [Clostridia bacterium]
MKTIDVYLQYIKASCVFNGVQRNGAAVRLTAESDAGQITYTVSVSFFPHETEDDFRISYDAEASKTVYQAKGRRSKKREQTELLPALRAHADELAASLNGSIDWESPLIEARMG